MYWRWCCVSQISCIICQRYGGNNIGEYQIKLMPPMHLHTYLNLLCHGNNRSLNLKIYQRIRIIYQSENNSWLKLHEFQYYHKTILLDIFNFVCRHLKLISVSDKISEPIFLNKTQWLPLALQPQGLICIKCRYVRFYIYFGIIFKYVYAQFREDIYVKARGFLFKDVAYRRGY